VPLDVLEQLAQVPSLIGGSVEFDRADLAGGEADEIQGDLDRVWVPLPEASPGAADPKELHARLRLANRRHLPTPVGLCPAPLEHSCDGTHRLGLPVARTLLAKTESVSKLYRLHPASRRAQSRDPVPQGRHAATLQRSLLDVWLAAGCPANPRSGMVR
jgi:hypothetical protein